MGLEVAESSEHCQSHGCWCLHRNMLAGARKQATHCGSQGTTLLPLAKVHHIHSQANTCTS